MVGRGIAVVMRGAMELSRRVGRDIGVEGKMNGRLMMGALVLSSDEEI